MNTYVLLVVLSLLFAVGSLIKPEAQFRLCSVAVLLIAVALLIGKT